MNLKVSEILARHLDSSIVLTQQQNQKLLVIFDRSAALNAGTSEFEPVCHLPTT